MCGYTSYQDSRLVPPDISDREEPEEEPFPLTSRLRTMLEKVGIEFTEGHITINGPIVSRVDVTTVWFKRGEASDSIELREDEDGLWLDSTLTPEEALVIFAACASGRVSWDD